ncbi:pyridoxamine 5'-phosphate oxidase family protein [Streptomyces sp. NPDC088789]|uniref:pyridoxamine 5'-phosphate oxidase family protein n=1 Tax=Streptomyces sp. NPDC088789 TaxID=3365899 RepID=UPI003819FF55
MPTDEAPADLSLATALLGRVDYGRVAASMRALPFLAPARHIVSDGGVLLRMHRHSGYQQACVGHVVAYGTDNMSLVRPGSPGGQWSVQVVGECAAAEPTSAELTRLGPAPRLVDGRPFAPVYLRVSPRFATVHSMDDGSDDCSDDRSGYGSGYGSDGGRFGGPGGREARGTR